MIDSCASPLEQLRRVASSLLDPQRLACSLRTEVLEMTVMLADAGTLLATHQKDIAHGETRTSQGLALSPAMAAICAEDFVRTIQFIRGTHAAIVDIRKRCPDRPARVLYVGCGPYAPLVVPLMAIFSPAEATFSLLDIHPESIKSAKSVVAALGLAACVANFETLDAASYRICPDRQPDILLMEIMRACLESEPQVALTRHLLLQAPNAIMIPEEVRIDLALVDLSCEFDLDGPKLNRASIQRDRISLASVFAVNRETVDLWKSNRSNRLPAAAVQLPASIEQRHQPMLFTKIRVYQDHILKDYDSGLTCPKTLTIKGPIRSGDTIQFHYELGSHPRLTGEILQRHE